MLALQVCSKEPNRYMSKRAKKIPAKATKNANKNVVGGMAAKHPWPIHKKTLTF